LGEKKSGIKERGGTIKDRRPNRETENKGNRYATNQRKRGSRPPLYSCRAKNPKAEGLTARFQRGEEKKEFG